MKITLTKRRVFHYWLVLFPFFLVLWYFPYIDFPIRVATWTVALLILIGSVFYAWKFRILRWLLIGTCCIAVLFLCLPSNRSIDRSALQSDYCAALKSFMGCRYMWGGEGYFGVDCSGLVQRGMENALVVRGLLTLNPTLVREGIWAYWHRTTAKVLGKGDFGRTTIVTTCPTLNSLDYSLMMPGDLAVTVGGDHVMAYLGNRTWTAADPLEGKVTTFTIPEEKNVYFFTPMKIMRWKILSE